MWTVRRVVAPLLALLAVSCASGPPVGSLEHPDCAAAVDTAVLEGQRWLSDLEIHGEDAERPDPARVWGFDSVCTADPAGAYSAWLVRTHGGFQPVTPAGEAARRLFLTSGCDARYPLAQLSEEARRVCTGG